MAAASSLPRRISEFMGVAFFAIALIWLAHIGFDRAAGFGLKYTGAFGDTHLGLSRRR